MRIESGGVGLQPERGSQGIFWSEPTGRLECAAPSDAKLYPAPKTKTHAVRPAQSRRVCVVEAVSTLPTLDNPPRTTLFRFLFILKRLATSSVWHLKCQCSDVGRIIAAKAEWAPVE
jgi:hypothetical protein